MNRRIFARSRRQIVVVALAATLALTATFGQVAIGHLLGADGASTVYACQSQGSGAGGC